MIGTFAGWARSIVGHVMTVPPISPINSRRLTRPPICANAARISESHLALKSLPHRSVAALARAVQGQESPSHRTSKTFDRRPHLLRFRARDQPTAAKSCVARTFMGARPQGQSATPSLLLAGSEGGAPCCLPLAIPVDRKSGGDRHPSQSPGRRRAHHPD